MKKLCVGCKAVEEFGHCCFRIAKDRYAKPIHKEVQCPCIDCLIKAICINKFLDCKIFMDFLHFQRS